MKTPLRRFIALFVTLTAFQPLASHLRSAVQEGRKYPGRTALFQFPIALYASFLYSRSNGVRDGGDTGGWTLPAKRAQAMTIAFNPSGTRLAVSAAPHVVRVLDTGNGKELLSHDLGDAHYDSAVFSNDGKAIVSPQGRRAVELWDATSGETVRRFEIPDQKGKTFGQDGRVVAVELGVDPKVSGFSSDGGLLAVEAGHELVLFDVATGKPRLVVSLLAGGESMPGRNPAVCTVGQAVLATAHFSKIIVLWDLKTGKKLRELAPEVGSVCALSISPNGRTLASCTGFWDDRTSNMASYDRGDHAVQLWELASGRPLLKIKGHTDNVRSVAYSPDGSFLLSGSEDKTICMWEAATGKLLLRWVMNEMVKQVAISPDGKKVAAVLDDGSVTLFPIDSPQPDEVRPPVDAGAFGHLWDDLGGEDAERGYAVIRALSEAGGKVVSEIAKRLRPVPAVRPADLNRLVADLDAADFDRREAASKALAALGAQAEAPLRKALEETSSEEVRSRIEPLLKPLDQWVVTDPETLRALRAIWVLERIGTPEARAVLEDLAQGAPEVRQTQEAKAALDFLDKRAAAAKP